MHDGMPVASGERPWGSNVTLNYNVGLRIENARGADSGTYTVEITAPGFGEPRRPIDDGVDGRGACASDVDAPPMMNICPPWSV